MNKSVILICGMTFMIFSGVVAVPAVAAQEMKIGYVDPRAILERMPEMKAVQQRLQNLYERKQNELTVMEQELQSEIEAYQQNAGVISEQARQAGEERLTQMDLDLRQLQSAAQQELQQQRIELVSPLLERIQTSVQNVAAQRNLDLVLNTTTAGYGISDRIIIHVSSELQTEYNITRAVMEDLDI